MSKLTQCPECFGFIPTGETECPHCGQTLSLTGTVRSRGLLAATGLAIMASCHLATCYGTPMLTDCAPDPCADASVGDFCRMTGGGTLFCCGDAGQLVDENCPEPSLDADAGTDGGADAGADGGS